MPDIKILDCTLRDGGYINNWDFGYENSKNIIRLLNQANIDFIETGFLTKEKSLDSQTLFNSFENIKNFIPENINKSKLFAMIKFGCFPFELIPDFNNSPISGIRVIFKKNQKEEALKYCREIKSKGYKLFINPTFINQYSKDEFESLLEKTQQIKPYGFTITDSIGIMKENDINYFYKLIENHLSKDIILCFHSHNNLQLSFSNAQTMINICKRNLIIDSTIFGMGRGAGNLSGEIITQYLNNNYQKSYNLLPVLKIIEKYINPIYRKNPWGYSVPYLLSAVNHCHPDYAKFLSQKRFSFEQINSILSKIPEDKKSSFDLEFISISSKAGF